MAHFTFNYNDRLYELYDPVIKQNMLKVGTKTRKYRELINQTSIVVRFEYVDS